MRALWTRIRNAIFGTPLTHDEAKARHEAQIAAARSTAQFESGARARSIQGQTWSGI